MSVHLAGLVGGMIGFALGLVQYRALSGLYRSRRAWRMAPPRHGKVMPEWIFKILLGIMFVFIVGLITAIGHQLGYEIANGQFY